MALHGWQVRTPNGYVHRYTITGPLEDDGPTAESGYLYDDEAEAQRVAATFEGGEVVTYGEPPIDIRRAQLAERAEALRVYVAAVLDVLAEEYPDVRAMYEYSGGGIFGISLDLGARGFMFTALDGDGASAWAGFDWTDRNGGLVAYVEFQERPMYGTHSTEPAPVDEMAAAIAALYRAMVSR